MSDAEYMRLAIRTALEGVAKGNSPFGAVIVKGDLIVVAAHNVVLETTDSTAHAEVNAIRQACRALNTIDLCGCRLYTTTEPCPMCFSAIHWARIGKIFYGCDIADAQQAGFSELQISNAVMKDLGGSKMEIVPNLLRDEAMEAYRVFLANPDRRVY